jgi:hypothetical protein
VANPTPGLAWEDPLSICHSQPLPRFFRDSGAMDSMGKTMEVTKYTEKLVPSTRFVAVDDVGPTVSAESFIAPSASVIGNVTVGKHTR